MDNYLRGDRSRRLCDRDSFTLIELLIVVAIIGVLAATVTLVINPTQLIAEGRDSTRMQDVKNLNNAIGDYLAGGDSSLGVNGTVYISIPDTTSTCSDLGLPALPIGWYYHCVSTSTLRNTDGTGWVPIDFQSVTTGSPLPSLPIDPVNATTSGEYYTYATNGVSYELTANFESNNYQANYSSGGLNPAVYSIGTNVSLTPFAQGLIGYWKFNDGAQGIGKTTVDSSGWGDSAVLGDATSTGTGPTYQSSGCVEGGCYSLDSSDDYITLSNLPVNTSSGGQTTVVFWMNWNSVGNAMPFGFYNYDLYLASGYFGFNTACSDVYGIPWTNLPSGWVQVAAIFTNDNVLENQLYINGVRQTLTQEQGTPCSPSVGATAGIGTWPYNNSYFFGNQVDDVMIYNHALSSGEVQAIYNSQNPS